MPFVWRGAALSTVPSAGLTRLATVGWVEPLFMALASVRSGCEVTTVCLEEGGAVEPLVESVCVFEATGDRFVFLKSGALVGGGPDSFVFFFLRRPPNVGIAARRGGYRREGVVKGGKRYARSTIGGMRTGRELDLSLSSMRLFGDLHYALITLR